MKKLLILFAVVLQKNYPRSRSVFNLYDELFNFSSKSVSSVLLREGLITKMTSFACVNRADKHGHCTT